MPTVRLGFGVAGVGDQRRHEMGVDRGVKEPRVARSRPRCARRHISARGDLGDLRVRVDARIAMRGRVRELSR